MAARVKRIYWDVCLFLAMLEDPEESEQFICCSNLFQEAKDNGEVLIYTSSLTIAQCPNVKENEDQEEAIKGFFTTKCIKVVDPNRWIAEKSREIRRQVSHWTDRTTILSLEDSLHLATALSVNVDKMLTYDKDDLIPLSKRFYTRDGHPLIIAKPVWQGTPRML